MAKSQRPVVMDKLSSSVNMKFVSIQVCFSQLHMLVDLECHFCFVGLSDLNFFSHV
jgi:hypothetical protein